MGDMERVIAERFGGRAAEMNKNALRIGGEMAKING
jgi:Pyruvate/2-oxoacid:ferredoxin oxidoreductase gamma subunit